MVIIVCRYFDGFCLGCCGLLAFGLLFAWLACFAALMRYFGVLLFVCIGRNNLYVIVCVVLLQCLLFGFYFGGLFRLCLFCVCLFVVLLLIWFQFLFTIYLCVWFIFHYCNLLYFVLCCLVLFDLCLLCDLLVCVVLFCLLIRFGFDCRLIVVCMFVVLIDCFAGIALGFTFDYLFGLVVLVCFDLWAAYQFDFDFDVNWWVVIECVCLLLCYLVIQGWFIILMSFAFVSTLICLFIVVVLLTVIYFVINSRCLTMHFTLSYYQLVSLLMFWNVCLLLVVVCFWFGNV